MRGKLMFGAATAALLMSFVPAALAQDADPAGDASTTATLSGDGLNGTIDSAGDRDWYRLSVEQGRRYSFTLDGVVGADGNAIDPMLGIYDADGNQLAFNDDADGLNSALQYSPGASGQVFVEASEFSGEGVGPYRLSVTSLEIPPDDAGNDTSSRSRITAGRAVSGNLEYEGDTDWYRLSVRTGNRYRIALDGAEGEGGVGDPYLRLVDADGNEINSSDDTENSLNSALEFIPRENGDVFVVAGGYADAYTGAYTLSVDAERMPRDNISADRSTRGRLTIGQSVDGALDFPTDFDWYRVRLEEGQSYRFQLVSSGDNPLSDPFIRVYGADGAELAMDDDGGEGLNSYLEFTAPTTGNYFVEARGFGDESTGSYTLSAAAGDIPGDASTDIGLSAEGDYREGMLSPAGDRDWYRLTLGEGQALRINLNSAIEYPDALGDPYLVLYGPDGAEITRDDDGGENLNSYMEYQATGAGTYFLEVRGYTEDAIGRYQVMITPGEIGDSFETADYMMPGYEGRVSYIGSPEDADWFGVELIEGRSYRIMLDGVDPNVLADPLLRLYDQQGTEVAMDDDGGPGLNSYISLASVTGGTYFVSASAFDGGVGTYLLRVVDTEVPGNVYTDENLDSTDDSRSSRIELPGDLDSYRVSLEEGVRYEITVSGEGDYPLADAFVAVLNAEGATLASDDDSGPGLDARLRFTPETTGEYYIQASGLGGSTGTYQVRIVRQ